MQLIEKTCQDTFEGSKAPCPLRDACCGCAKGKYSQITGEEGMISATMNKRGGIRKEDLYTKLERGADFQDKVYVNFHFRGYYHIISIVVTSPFLSDCG